MSLEIVEWWDAVTYNGWQRKDGDYERALCISVGWVVQDDSKLLALAPNIQDMDDPIDRQIGDVTIIPKGMIRKRKKLRP